MCLLAQEGLCETGKFSGLDGWVSTMYTSWGNYTEWVRPYWLYMGGDGCKIVILIGYLEGMVFGQMNEIGESHFYFVESFDLQLVYAHWERGEQQLTFTSHYFLLRCIDC